jgi:L-2,4-diaminobutyric acid acetyltransferase
MTKTDTLYRTQRDHDLTFRHARPGDGLRVWQLVQQVGTLETNSAYFYLIFCTDFADTSVVAEHDGALVGALIGYRSPKDQAQAFCWQIGVLPDWQGKGVAGALLNHWLLLPALRTCTWLTATVATDNAASDHLFRRYASQRDIQCFISKHFTVDLLPEGHAPERLYRIGPLPERGQLL